MKRKIFCLAICLLCIVAALVSCGNKCEAHVDADKNTLCDNCKVPVVTITEEILKDEVIDTVFAEIPEGATYADLINTDATPVLGNLEKQNFKNADIIGDALDFIIYTYKAQNSNFKSWVMFNPFTKASVTLLSQNHGNDNAYVAGTYGSIIKVYIANYDADGQLDDTYYDYYTASGEKLFSTKKDANDERLDVESPYTVDNITYVTTEKDEVETTYAIDAEGKIAHKDDAEKFVKRPDMDEIVDNYGFVKLNGTVYVYDLSEWMKCVYSYELPTYFNDCERFYLNDGKILVQGEKALPASAINYDFLDNSGNKYDLVYILVDHAADTKEKEIEFGYYIDEVYVFQTGVVNADIAYGIFANDVVNGVIDEDNYLTLYTKEDLTVVAESEALNPEFVDLYPYNDNVLLGEVNYGTGSTVYKLYDYSGNELATLPNSLSMSDIKETYIKYNGAYYNFKMEKIFDPKSNTEDPYTVYGDYDTFVLLRKGNVTYYWNATLAAPVVIADATNTDVTVTTKDDNVDNTYIVIRTNANGVTKYTLYNDANVKVLDAEANFSAINYDEDDFGNYYWKVTLTDGTIYYGK